MNLCCTCAGCYSLRVKEANVHVLGASAHERIVVNEAKTDSGVHEVGESAAVDNIKGQGYNVIKGLVEMQIVALGGVEGGGYQRWASANTRERGFEEPFQNKTVCITRKKAKRTKRTI